MLRAPRRQNARIELKAGYVRQAEFCLRVAAKKRLQRLPGNASAPPYGHMWVKGFEVGFQTRVKYGILNSPM